MANQVLIKIYSYSLCGSCRKALTWLNQKNHPVVILGLNDSHQLNTSALKFKKMHYLVGKTSIVEASQIIQNCDTFIGIDTGTSHIASALKKPSLVLFTGKGLF